MGDGVANSIWPGLLKWSLTQTDGLGYSSEDQPKALSEEDKKFLTDAFESLIVDEVKRIKVISNVLKLPEKLDELKEYLTKNKDGLKIFTELEAKTTKEQTSLAAAAAATPATIPSTEAEYLSLLHTILDKKAEALDELDDRILSIDNANDLFAVGGLIPLINELNSSDLRLVWRAAHCLATMNQNNPKGQAKSIENNAVPILTKLLLPNKTNSNNNTTGNDQGNEQQIKVHTKALYALSAILRGENSPAFEQFQENNGLSYCTQLLQTYSTQYRLVTKVLSLLKFLLPLNETVKSIITSNLLPLLIQLLTCEDISCREENLHLLIELSKSKQSRDAIKQQGLELERGVHQRLETIAKAQSEEAETAESEKKLLIKLARSCNFKL
jgi:hsp70-interacting protein